MFYKIVKLAIILSSYHASIRAQISIHPFIQLAVLSANFRVEAFYVEVTQPLRLHNYAPIFRPLYIACLC